MSPHELTRRRPTDVAKDETKATVSEGTHRRPRRWSVVVGIALIEGVVVALSPGITRWTVIGLAALAFVLYLTVGRSRRRGAIHEILWMFAISQALAVIVAVLAFFFSWMAYALAALLALAVLVLLLFDR